MNDIVDITKRYTTRSGLPVRIYAVDCGGARPVHFAAQNNDGTWTAFSAMEDGHVSTFCRSQDDLAHVKTWREWRSEEAPVCFMARNKNDGSTIVGYGAESALRLRAFFDEYDRLHEDGTTTPCGVKE